MKSSSSSQNRSSQRDALASAGLQDSQFLPKRTPSDSGEKVLAEWEQRKQAAGFNRTDAERLRGLRPDVEAEVERYVDLFYERLLAHGSMREFVTDPEVVARLKRIQRDYILEIFSGDYGEAYVQRRVAIGHAHERLGLPPQWYVLSYSVYVEQILKTIFQSGAPDCGGAATAFLKLILLDISVVSTCYVDRYVEGIEDLNRMLLARLDRDESLLETISDTSIDAIFSLNASGHIQFWNRAAERIMGLDGKSLEGRALVELLRPRVQQELPDRLRTQQATELTYTHPNGDRKTLLLSAVLLRDDRHEDVRATVILRDITEKRRLQERVTVMEKISAMARVSGAIAHEIRTPLGALLLQTDLLAEHLDTHGPDGGGKEWLSTARDMAADLAIEADRLSNIVSDYLSMLRISRISPLETDLVEYMQRMEEEFKRRLDRWSATLHFDIPDDLPAVRLDQDQFRRVLLNLINNAVEASSGQGNLWIGAKRANGEVEISVADDGPGVVAVDRERILEPFYTTKREGTGLGLYLVQEIVSAHGGRLILEENQPCGLRVSTRLPISGGGK